MFLFGYIGILLAPLADILLCEVCYTRMTYKAKTPMKIVTCAMKVRLLLLAYFINGVNFEHSSRVCLLVMPW